ncbi:hypothetical protein ES703_79974 [subsurface metagenome]
MKKLSFVAILAILCITALLVIAIANDVDGALLSAGIAVIAGLGGYTLHKKTPLQ